MTAASDELTRRCDEELAAAEAAPCRETRLAHLEEAFRLAQKACAERDRTKPVSIVNWVEDAKRR